MRWLFACTAPALLLFVGACSDADGDDGPPSSASDVDSGEGGDAGSGGGADAPDAATLDARAFVDGGIDGGNDGEAGNPNACSYSGAPGECMAVSACAAIADHSSFPGQCLGPSSVECCIDTPDTADNPPFPTGYKLLTQAMVTPAMTTWAVSILHDPVTYPMFSTTTMMFGAQLVLAQVEWHPPDFQNSVVHRGVTLFEPG